MEKLQGPDEHNKYSIEYEPFGEVGTAVRRGKAQKPSEDSLRQVAPATTETAADRAGDDEPQSLAAGSAVSPLSERVTSAPKRKIISKSGSSNSYSEGARAPTSGAIRLHSASPTAVSAPVGAARRTFAKEIWTEKTKERRLSCGYHVSLGTTEQSTIEVLTLLEPQDASYIREILNGDINHPFEDDDESEEEEIATVSNYSRRREPRHGSDTKMEDQTTIDAFSAHQPPRRKTASVIHDPCTDCGTLSTSNHDISSS
jgi:hypothetical protein